MLTDEQVEAAATETMVTTTAIRAAAATLCAPREAHTPADVVAVTIRLLMQRTPATAASSWSRSLALLER
jgi:hypothetical protein